MITEFMKSLLIASGQQNGVCEGQCEGCQYEYREMLDSGFPDTMDFATIYAEHHEEIWRLLAEQSASGFGTAPMLPVFIRIYEQMHDQGGLRVPLWQSHSDFCKAMVTAAAQVAGKGEGK